MALLVRSARQALLGTRKSMHNATWSPQRAKIMTGTVSTTPSILSISDLPPNVISRPNTTSTKAANTTLAPLKLSSAPQFNTPTIPPTAPHQQPSSPTNPLTPQIRRLLPLLASQPAHYITIHLHGHPYLLTTGDTIRLPFRMPSVSPGDILRLTRATHLGSRDYTLLAPAPTRGSALAPKKIHYLDERLFVCRAVVLGEETEPMRVERKTKRRQRHVKHVSSKMRFTVLRCSEVRVRGVEEVEGLVERGRET